MNSVGGFLEKEIDGKPFHIITLPSQIDPSSSIDSGEDDNEDEVSLHQPRFLCPSLRREAERLKRKEKAVSGEKEEEEEALDYPVSVSPYFPNIKNSVDQHTQDLHPVLPLFWCNVEDYNEEYCATCISHENGSGYYLCVVCDSIFHKECVESPLEIKVPSYPFLSLQLHVFPTGATPEYICVICDSYVNNIGYSCPDYKVCMHQICAMKPIPIVIDHFKRHPHPLTFFPKQSSLACDVCGMVKPFIPTYVCARCVFVVHQDCIYFPYVIRISRHQHRISFTYSLPSGNLSCGVCRRKVNNDCGAYSCTKCDENYFVHSRCALRRDLWDGEELEGVPEEPEVVVEPFETIADGIILHFSHGHHHLKLEISKIYDERLCCQACVIPIYEGHYYSCVDNHCDFLLHETCASAPLKIHNPLNARPLTLKIVTNEYNDNRGYFECNACQRKSCGFVYEGSRGDWGTFRLDLRCASISEPFHYGSHKHPLFLALTPKEEESAMCQICGDYERRKLSCIECNYNICFKCATLPYKAKYKHDKHFLTFRKEMVVSDQSDWCEVCEKKIVYSGKQGFYACDDYCCTTLHVDCLLGKDPYMKHGQIINVGGMVRRKIHILPNYTMSRPFCHGIICGCGGRRRCRFRIVFEKKNLTYCYYLCCVMG